MSLVIHDSLQREKEECNEMSACSGDILELTGIYGNSQVCDAKLGYRMIAHEHTKPQKSCLFSGIFISSVLHIKIFRNL